MLKLNDLDTKLRERIQRQIDQEDAAKCSHLPVGGLAPAVTEQNEVRSLDRKPSPRKSRKSRVLIVVTFVPYCLRATDEDNIGHSAYKSMRDEIAKQIGIDDRDKRIRFEYAPPVVTKGRPGTHVTITTI